jgi:hypothetical protein
VAVISVITPTGATRRWHHELIVRLRAAGHAVAVVAGKSPAQPDRRLDQMLGLERLRFGETLASPAGDVPIAAGAASPDLVFDLTASVDDPNALVFDFGQTGLGGALAELFAHGTLPTIVLRRAGQAVAVAWPMIDDPLWLTRSLDKLLAAAITLAEHAAARREAGLLGPVTEPPRTQKGARLGSAYLPHLIGGVAERLKRKATPGTRPFYWQVGYRHLPPGVDTLSLAAQPPFITLPDDGHRFYADPFLLRHDDRDYLFVEEFPYALGRGILSVSVLDSDGTFSTPRAVIEEPHHLSYPQVFAHEGEIYMIPESSGAREVVLYRATQFPDSWTRDTVLIAGHPISDATLVVHDGRFWLIGTQQYGRGSHSDTMVVYHADTLRGPYQPHRLNPILVDRAAARPGGLAFPGPDGLMMPFQDGSRGYGGGLGLAPLIRLDEDEVVFGSPTDLGPVPGRAGLGTHTLNRLGAIEVVDWSPATKLD